MLGRHRERKAARALREAIDRSDHGELARLLQAGQSPDSTDPEEIPLLSVAVGHRDAESVRLLLRYGASVRGTEDCPLRLLRGLFGYGRSESPETREVFLILLGAGADPNDVDMYDVARWGIAWVAPLLEAGLDVHREQRLTSPLQASVLSGDPEVVAAMLDRAGELPPKLVRNLFRSAARINAIRLLELFQSRLPGGVHPQDACAAAFEDQLESLRFFLDAGVDPNSDEIGGTLLSAAAFGSPACVRLLVERGADVQRPSRSGSLATPLMSAARRHNADVVRLLLDFGATLEARDRFGRTAVDHARAGLADVTYGSADPDEEAVERFHAVMEALGATP